MFIVAASSFGQKIEGSVWNVGIKNKGMYKNNGRNRNDIAKLRNIKCRKEMKSSVWNAGIHDTRIKTWG